MDAPAAARTAHLVARLRSGDWAAAERAERARRLASASTAAPPHPTPRDGFKALVGGSLDVVPQEVDVVSEREDAIFWEQRDACPLLAACESLRLDTRTACRRVCEKPAQALLSRMDPGLRLVRDYGRLRPHAAACREGILRVDLAGLMDLALEEARASRAGGDKGYGAVVWLGGEVVARAHDTGTTERDPSLHAEVRSLRAAVGATGDPDLCGAVLVSTCEPCPMCSSLAVWANVTSIVYGASIAKTAALGKTRILIGAEEVVARGPAMIEVIGGVREAECLELYR